MIESFDWEELRCSRRTTLKILSAAAIASLPTTSYHMPSERPDRLDYTLPTSKSFGLVGTALSGWQGNPEHAESDWGQEVRLRQEGKKSGIKGNTSPQNFPNFDEEYSVILPRANEVNNNSFRTSLDFARLCPQEGVFDENLMAHYVRILARCHFQRLEPAVALNHWTMPKSMATYDAQGVIKNGPLEHPRIVEHFIFYVNKVADFLCDPEKIRAALQEEGYQPDFLEQMCDARLLCRWFITLNEPHCLLVLPYLQGAFPPYQKGKFGKYPELLEKLRQMHIRAYEVLHETAISTQPVGEQKALRVGMVHNVTTESSLPLVEQFLNWGLVERMQNGVPDDFMGLQYYTRMRLALSFKGVGVAGSDPRYHSDMPEMGQVYPTGVYDVLKTASGMYPDKTLLLSEFGFADNSDVKRPDWIMESVYHLIRAKREGVNVQGVFLWSLIRNFEWIRGMDVSFGILDQHGQRLPTDREDSGLVSSREAWSVSSQHLLSPTPESAAALQALRLRTKQQLEQAVQEK